MRYRLRISLLVALVPIIGWADQQSDRLTFIQRLTDRGIFHSTNVEYGAPRLVVTQEFYESDIESKQTAVRIVYEYYFELDNSYDTLRIIDGSTGADIGTYTVEGLQL